MKQLLALVLLLAAYQSQAQSRARFHREDLFYGDYLREVRSSDSLARLTRELQRFDQVAGDSLPAAYFSRGRYRLCYFTTVGWEQYLNEPRRQFSRQFASTSGKLFTSRELFRQFSLHNQDSTVLRRYPLVQAREDAYNRRWVPVAPNAHYLVLSYVHSYPDGNANSWYVAEAYYFERAQ